MKASVQLDVCIAGGGPAGCAAAIQLARAGLHVAIVDRDLPKSSRSVDSLSPRVQLCLEELDALEGFRALPKLEFPGLASVWGSDALGERDFLGSVFGCGWHVDRGRFNAMLREQAIRCGVIAVKPAVVRRVSKAACGAWQIQCMDLTQGSEWKCEAAFVIDATGRGTGVASRLGARRQRFDRQIAICAHVASAQTEFRDDLRLLLEAVTVGWWYTSPLPQGGRMLVLVTDADLIPSTAVGRRRFWHESLASAAHVRKWCDVRRFPEKLRVVAADTSLLCPACGVGWIAVGDAALALDPLSGQGVLRGLQDGLRAADHIRALAERQSLGPTEWNQRARRLLNDGLVERQRFYGAQQRWPQSPFWRRRHVDNPIAQAIQ